MSEQQILSNNPAGRLYDILSRSFEADPYEQYFIQSIGETDTQERTARDVLSEVLEIDPGNTAEFFRQVTQLFSLVSATRDATRRLQGVNPERYLKALDDIERVLGEFDFKASWLSIKRSFNSDTLTRLEFCADALSHQQGEVVIDKERLEELQTEVESLIEKVTQSDLSEEVKLILLEKLHDISKAIRNYRISGSKSLLQAVEASVGAAFLKQDEIKKNPGSEVVSKFFEVVTRLNSLLNVGSKVPEIVSYVRQNLLDSGNS